VKLPTAFVHPPARACAAASAGTALALIEVLRLGVRGTISTTLTGAASAALLIAAVLLGKLALAAAGLVSEGWPRHLSESGGFLGFVCGVVLGLPSLGAGGLVDPWETHYAEVAREMLARGDFISPWWANEGWFRSKPVLVFWLEAASMALLGVNVGPDAMLGGAGADTLAAPEWAVRLPAFLCALGGVYLLQRGVAQVSGARAAFFGSVVLWTMPGYALLSHQALTDMPLVAAVAASLGLVLAALATPDNAVVRRHPVRLAGRHVDLHAGHLLAAACSLVLLPQIFLLLSLHVHVVGHGLRLGADRLVSGSPSACTLPGQPPCELVPLAHPRLQPVVQALIWGAPMFWILTRAATEVRTSRLLALGAWLAAALATMAKGPAGLAIPAAAVAVHMIATRSLRALAVLEVLPGIALAAVAVGPWYLAAYARHGRSFLDELVMRNMLGRTLSHLHDTNEGEDIGLSYFVRQLGFATFPWTGLALSAVFAYPTAEAARERQGRAILVGAVLTSFTLVSLMETKFHHYVLVALPAIAMLAGIWLDAALAPHRASGSVPRREPAFVTWIGAAAVVAVVGRELAGVDHGGPARFAMLLTYRYTRAWPSTRSFGSAVAVVAVVATAALLAAALPRARRGAVFVLGSSGAALAALLLWRYLPACGLDGGQRAVLAAYYADRPRDSRAPLVAYQLNWKGENFYTGNRVAIFIRSGAPLRDYLARRHKEGESTVYFETERPRLKGLERELGTVRSFVELTAPSVSSEYSLVRVEL
jgi:4-amino-4-deoxy-L-arabinose transferase-like glycosyltransferase